MFKYSTFFLKIPFVDSLRNVQLITVRLLVFRCNDIFSKKENKNTVKVFVLVWFLQK